jgi:hypothetical protein
VLDILLEGNADLTTRLAAKAISRKEFFTFSTADGNGMLLTYHPTVILMDDREPSLSFTASFSKNVRFIGICPIWEHMHL